jgi:hypothetical protein
MPDNLLYPPRVLGKSRLAKLREERAGMHETSFSGNRAPLRFQTYLLAIPQAIMGTTGLLGTWYLLHAVRPSEIANWGGESVYFPLLFLVSWTSFWLVAFLIQHWRRATIVASIVLGWTWLRLHNQSVFPILFLLAGLLSALELYLTNREAQA